MSLQLNAIESAPRAAAAHARLRAFLRSEWGQFAQFVRKPTRARPRRPSAGPVLARIAFLLALSAIFVMLVSLPLNWMLATWADVSRREPSSMRALWLLGVLVAPAAEELIFRAGLRSAPYTLFIGPACISLYAGALWFSLGVALLLAAIGTVDMLQRRRARLAGTAGLRFARGRRYIQRYASVFHVYAIGFALSHIGNFEFSGWSGLLVVGAVSSQLMDGYILGYLRLRTGLASAWLFHTLNNLIWLSLAVLLPF